MNKNTTAGLKTGSVNSIFVIYIVFYMCYAASFYIGKAIFDSLETDEGDELCPSNPKPSNYSSESDVVFLYGDSMTPGLHLTIKSLRSTGCRARIVLFAGVKGNKHKIPSSFIKKFNIELVDQFTNPYDKKPVPHMIRYSFELEWLRLNGNQTSRVLHSDAYDVFFQADPFKEDIPSDALLFIVEPHVIRSCGWNLEWFKEVYGKDEADKFMNEFIVCSGTISGNSMMYQRLLALLVSKPEWERSYGHSHDQPILIHSIWSGDVEKAGIEYKFGGCDSGFMTVHWCVLNMRPLMDKNGRVLTHNGILPSYIHQYNRIPKLSEHFYEKCGI